MQFFKLIEISYLSEIILKSDFSIHFRKYFLLKIIKFQRVSGFNVLHRK